MAASDALDSLEPASDVTVDAVVFTLLLNGILFLFLIAVYSVLRNVVPRVYADREYRQKGSRMVSFQGLNDNRMPLSWVPTILSVRWETLHQSVTLDAYFFLRFIYLCFWLTMVPGFWAAFSLWPIYSTAGGGQTGFYRPSIVNIKDEGWQIWMAPLFMWGLTLFARHTISEEYEHFVTLRKDYFSNGSGYRKTDHHFSLMIEQIPSELQSDAALKEYFNYIFPGKVHSAHVVLNLSELETLSNQRLLIVDKLEKAHEYFRIKNKHSVVRVREGCSVIKTKAIDYYQGKLNELNGDMKELQAKMLAIAEMRPCEENSLQKWINLSLGPNSFRTATTVLDGASETQEAFYECQAINNEESGNEPDSRCSCICFHDYLQFVGDKLGFSFLRGKYEHLRADTGLFSKYFLNKCLRRNTIMENSITTRNSPKTSTGFVTLIDLSSVSTAVGTTLCHIPDALNTCIAPAPTDIIWNNIHMHQSIAKRAHTFACYAVAVGAVLWSIPVALVQFYASSEFLAKVPGFEWILSINDGRFAIVLNGYLPVIALLLIILILPIWFRFLATRIEWRKTRSDVENSILTRFFMYQLANIYVTTTAGSLWRSLADIIDDPSNGFVYFGTAFQKYVGYFVSFILIKILSGLPSVLLRSGPLLRLAFLNIFARNRTVRQEENVYRHQELRYGVEYPTQLLVLVISFTYACICPIILLVAALYFAFAFIVYKNQIMFVYSDMYEGGGILFRSAVNRVFVGLILSQCVLIGILLTSHAYFAPIALIPCPFMTFSTIKEFERKYFQPSCTISLERAVEIDRSRNRLSFELFKDAKQAYRQPVLLEEELKPKFREEMSHSVAEIQEKIDEGNINVDTNELDP